MAHLKTFSLLYPHCCRPVSTLTAFIVLSVDTQLRIRFQIIASQSVRRCKNDNRISVLLNPAENQRRVDHRCSTKRQLDSMFMEERSEAAQIQVYRHD